MEHTDHCAEPALSFTLDSALARMSAVITPLDEVESMALDLALGRVLAGEVCSPLELPPFPNSAMDGYALRQADLVEAAAGGLVEIGTAYAGIPFVGVAGPGECVRIFTGAAMPDGTDTVAMQEDATKINGRIRLAKPLAPRANVRPAGDEIHCGGRLMTAGKRLQAADLGLLASAGLSTVEVVRKIRVAYFSTGDELRPLGVALDYGQIYDSNRQMLRALLAEPAIEAVDLGVVPDQPEAVRDKLRQASTEVDVIISSGGVSVGDADFVTAALAELGRVEFWKLAIKPGKPLAFGRIGPAWFFGLPGNPVAVLVTFLQLVRPALARLMGQPVQRPLRLPALSRSTLKKAPGRMEFQRGVCGLDDDGVLTVTGLAGQGSHQLLGMSRANCFIVLPAENAGVQVGESVLIEPFAASFL